MSEFGGLWKHANNQHALVPPKTECGCPSGEGIKNGHLRYPSKSNRTTQKKHVYQKNLPHRAHFKSPAFTTNIYITYNSLNHLATQAKHKPLPLNTEM